MKKPVKVHMLPTEKPVIGCISNQKLIGRFLSIVDKFHKIVNLEANPTYDYYHLYFTSDEEINDYDYYICPEDKLRYCKTSFKIGGRKIVATTDKSLGEPTYKEWTKQLSSFKPLPQIHQSFVEEFVKAGGKIDKVLLEYEKHVDQHPDWVPSYNDPDNSSGAIITWETIKTDQTK